MFIVSHSKPRGHVYQENYGQGMEELAASPGLAVIPRLGMLTK